MVYRVGDVIQFNEKHKLCGSFGFIKEAKRFGYDTRYMVGVPIPQQGTACIFTMKSKEEFEKIGKAAFMPKEED